MRVDYRSFAHGVALSDKLRVSECPVCGKGCCRKDLATKIEFHHAVEITPGPVNDTTVEVVEKCVQTKEEHRMRPKFPEKKK